MTKVPGFFVGVDVSKDCLDIYISQADISLKIDNTDSGFKKLIKKLSVHDIECVAFESTGGYEAKMACALNKSGFQTWLIDPSRIKAFIRSRGVKAKTDKIDAKMIALFASTAERTYIAKQHSDEQIELRALVKRKEALINMIAMEKKRYKHPLQTTFCQESIADLIQYMEQQKAKVEKQINALIKSNSTWARKSSIMQSIPGIGETNAAVLISHMPELGTIENKQIAALLGVAPYTQESGKYTGKASIYGGRPTPRWPLYMAALTAVRCNQVLKEFYNRLREAGKPAKVALVAAMRKLICIINVMLKNDTYWKCA